jgi:hypothetical protein
MTKSDAIRLVLNKLIELYDIDTSSIWPDDRLTEIGIDPEMTRRTLRTCFIELGLNEHDGGSRDSRRCLFSHPRRSRPSSRLGVRYGNLIY